MTAFNDFAALYGARLNAAYTDHNAEDRAEALDLDQVHSHLKALEKLRDYGVLKSSDTYYVGWKAHLELRKQELSQ